MLAADLVLVNGRVLTMAAVDVVAQAMAVSDGKIVAANVFQFKRKCATALQVSSRARLATAPPAPGRA